VTAKEYLEEIGVISERIRQKEVQLECLRETAGGAAAIRYDKEQIKNSPQTDMLEQKVIELIELEESILVEKVHLEKLRAQIISQIHELDDERYIKILFKRYVEKKSFELIAVECSYNYDYIRELHSDAIRAFGRMVGMAAL
jgi:hypothetical protein